MAFINTPDLDRMIDILSNGGPTDFDVETEMLGILNRSKDGIADPALREAANDEYAIGSDNDIEIDDEPATSVGDNGVWVAAWVWMPNPEEDEEQEGNTDDEA